MLEKLRRYYVTQASSLQVLTTWKVVLPQNMVNEIWKW